MNSERKIYSMKEFRAIFLISSISPIRSVYVKQGQFSILVVFQNVSDVHKFGLHIWIQNTKITLWNSDNFFNFIDFSRQVRVYETRSFHSISYISKCMGFTIIWVAGLNSERKNYPMKEFRAIFPISSIFVIRSAYAKQGHIQY